MRIKVIIPNTSEEFVDGFNSIRKSLVVSDINVEFDVVCLKGGPVSLETGLDEGQAISHLIEEVIKANDERFDAITIDCAADPGSQALKEISDIPVVFAGESSYYYAMNLSRKFSLITVIENTKALNENNINKYCIKNRIASVRSANVPVLDVQDERKSYNAILIEARKAIEEDGAQAIVLGCTGMSLLVEKLQNDLGVPVIDPRRSAIHMAISLVSMKLSQSKVAYMKPPLK
ncbi:MAG: aspartate/glutamate racemase family protein [Bacillota bacterium]|nr:aspartate/glutamate racemase family protein [Bacillota bacterium]